METRTKQPGEQFPFAFDFYGKLPRDATIESAVVTAIDLADDSDATADIIVEDSTEVDETDVIFSVKGGEDGESYKITAVVTLSDNSILEEDLTLEVEEV